MASPTAMDLRLRPLRRLFDQAQIPSDTGACLELLYQAFRASFALHSRWGRYIAAFEPNNLPVRAAVPMVATIHDLSVVEYPQWHTPSRVARWRRHLTAALRHTARWITVSEFTRQRMVKLLGLDPLRITVIPEGARHMLLPSADDLARMPAAVGLPEQYLLFVGTLEPRKNLLGLLDAYGMLPLNQRRRTPLILVGRPGWGDENFWRALLDHRMADEALVTGFLDDRRLAEVLARASALLMPSFYEGFGLPVVEAMAAGCPVICSDIDAHREVAGEAAERIAPENTGAWSDAMGRAIEDASWRRQRRTAGIERIRTFSWERAARLHAEVIADAVGDAG
jgi:alpha-1,3-rhamnosyl/mannosyltransferase